MKRLLAYALLLFFLATGLVACDPEDDGNEPDNTCNLNFSATLADLPCRADTLADTLNGFNVLFHPGTTTRASEGNLDNGIRTGFWKYYQTDGTTLTQEGNFTNGQLQGFWKVFYDSGEIREEGNYEACIRDGFWKFYFDVPNNQVQFEGHYTNGTRTGVWKEYNQQGGIVAECEG
ncbi:MAG: toxin-antitoxin system YwqK family antitoxin [Salibacteraceae bacterium]